MHSMELPRRVIVGRGVIGIVGKTCESLGLSGVALVLTGPETYELAARAVIDSLEDAGFDTEYLKIGEPRLEVLEQAEAKVENLKPTAVLGVGGGRVIDAAKIVAGKRAIPYLSVPTAASHDGIASPQASIKCLGKPFSVRLTAPLAILADIEVISRSPYRLTASGCGDIISKFTAVRDWWLAHHLRNEYYGDYAANLALMSARIASRRSDTIRAGSDEGIGIVVEALISCGVAMSIAGSSRPCSGSEHLFSHALDRVAPKPALHGEQCGVGTIMMAYLHRINWKRIRDVLKRIGAPTTANELGVEPDHVVEALTLAHTIRPERYTILGERGLSRETALKLARSTGVIG
ncbi:MAG: NAD(P)-dependent glycerol-1-phosphate dehydrogenase [Candidatus Bathyarchaeia archaeon]